MSEPHLARVGLNALYIVPGAVGGTEIYARELTAALAAHRPETTFNLFLADEAHRRYLDWPWPPNVRLQHVPVPARRKPARLAAELSLLPVLDARVSNDVLHSLGMTAPLFSRSARVVTVHDLMYEHFPDAWPTSARLGQKLLVPAGARRSHRVITVSDAVRNDLVARLGLPCNKVDVVRHGLGMSPMNNPTPEVELRAKHHLGDSPVALCVSAAFPHKNLERLIRAFADSAVRQVRPEPVLVLVGHAGSLAHRLEEVVRELGLGDRVRMTGWVDESELEGLYGLATCFAYPSLFEGFGMPVLEAMRRGVPVICSQAWSLPEVVGNAAELCDPLSVESIAAAVARVLTSPKLSRELVDRGYAQTSGFTWARAAAQTWNSYGLAMETVGSGSNRRYQ